jgi:hypothetical protein
MVRGGLFTRYFLEDGIRQMPAYQRLGVSEVMPFGDFIRQQWRKIEQMPHPNEEEAIRETALIILYRLLFLFYAEDRDLLPVGKEAYAQYALRELRIEARDIIDSGRTLSESRTVWAIAGAVWCHCQRGSKHGTAAL